LLIDNETVFQTPEDRPPSRPPIVQP
jgi:hypothetical protein